MKMDFIANNKGLIFALLCLFLMPVLADYLLEEAHGQSAELPSGYDERVFVESRTLGNWIDEVCKPLNMLSSDLEHLRADFGGEEGFEAFENSTLNDRQKFCVTRDSNDLTKPWEG